MGQLECNAGIASRKRPPTPAVIGAAAPVAAALLLAACASTPRAPLPAPPAPKPVPLDASYDWHVLLLAPFGSVLKDVPLPLHEVLLFRDEAPGAPAADEAECYATDAAAPRFIAREPEEYLLCFKHDRLSRIEAAVRVPEAQAAKVFAAACGLWLKNAATALPPASGAPPPPTPPAVPAAAPPQAAACQGSAADIAFSASLEEEPDRADALLSIKLEAPHR
ncbi:MAG: hypothetical protein ACLPV8_03880 [Steroidobacteraceae bacterium]